MFVAMRTAQTLFDDAKILFGARRWPRAAALAVLALEEVGKIQLLMDIEKAGDDRPALKKAWKAYRSHPVKSSKLILPGDVQEESERLETQLGYGRNLDQLKQLGFYSNLLEDGSWTVPELVITEEIARSVLEFAFVLVGQLEELYRKDQAQKL